MQPPKFTYFFYFELSFFSRYLFKIMTVNVERANGSVTGNLSLPNGNDLADAIEEIKLRTDPVTPRKSIKKVHMNSTDSASTSSASAKSSNTKSSFFSFKKKSSKDNSQSIQNGNAVNGNGTTNEKSFSNKMRKFVSNGTTNSNAKAPVSRRKKRGDSSIENSQSSSAVSRSSSEPALNDKNLKLNQPQEAFVREAPSVTSLNKTKGTILSGKALFDLKFKILNLACKYFK